jgi:SpoVK/Ycf46/Vps4 family AAA+-type ATPase
MDDHGKDGISDKKRAFQLGDIAQHIEPKFTWKDLALSQGTISKLKDICNQARESHRVSREFGFDRKISQGTGLSVLFTGPSGSGKTMAAEVIASDLNMPLYLIDLSAAVSKYIGETEKNLMKVFNSAEATNAILLFDEADALFGKRTKSSDSCNRYMNIETGYLLQRIEEHTGITIITINMRQNLDQAFIRRMRFAVDFPFPANESKLKL